MIDFLTSRNSFQRDSPSLVSVIRTIFFEFANYCGLVTRGENQFQQFNQDLFNQHKTTSHSKENYRAKPRMQVILYACTIILNYYRNKKSTSNNIIKALLDAFKYDIQEPRSNSINRVLDAFLVAKSSAEDASPSSIRAVNTHLQIVNTHRDHTVTAPHLDMHKASTNALEFSESNQLQVKSVNDKDDYLLDPSILPYKNFRDKAENTQKWNFRTPKLLKTHFEQHHGEFTTRKLKNGFSNAEKYLEAANRIICQGERINLIKKGSKVAYALPKKNGLSHFVVTSKKHILTYHVIGKKKLAQLYEEASSNTIDKRKFGKGK